MYTTAQIAGFEEMKQKILKASKVSDLRDLELGMMDSFLEHQGYKEEDIEEFFEWLYEQN